MKNIFKKTVLLSLVTTLLTTGCTSLFEEINTDPDALTKVPYTNMLGNVLRYSTEQFGGDIEGTGTFAGYIVKIQYLNYMGDLIPTNNTYGNRWYVCYYSNTQLKTILDNTKDVVAENKNIRSVAKIWQSYCWQYCTDSWGDIPFSEALKGAEEEGGILNAKYDKQEDIYPVVMANLKEVADDLATGFGPDELGIGDFIYGGEMLKWQKFCNSLRLRMAMRISAVSPALSKSTIEEICGNTTKYPIIDSNDASCNFWWQGSAPYFERWYDNKRTRDDYGLFDIFIDHMKDMKDPRLASIAKPAESDNEYRGFQNGPELQPSVLKSVSRIGAMYRDDPKGFTPHFKACESYYIIAEAAMLGYNVGMTAGEAYEKAVRLSMDENNVDAADVETYLAGKGKWNNTKERIWWDEWVGLFKANHEAWCLYRRTGVPTTNYIAIKSIFGSAHNDQPFRLPYPNNEYSFNREKLDAALVGIVDYCWGKQMWWDTRTGVK